MIKVGQMELTNATFLLGRGNRDISAAETIISAFAREDAARSPP